MNLNVYAGSRVCDHCGERLRFIDSKIALCGFCEAAWFPAIATRHMGGFKPRYEVVIRV
jgi:hypothetical protein